MNTNPMINKKPLPWSPSKSQIYTIYVKQSRIAIQEEICEIIAKNRNKPKEDIKRVRILFHSEFAALVKLIGIPKDYYAPDGFFE